MRLGLISAVLAVAIGVVLVIVSSAHRAPRSAAPVTVPAPPTASGSAGPSAVASAPTRRVVLPRDMTWSKVVGLAVPVSATAGPAHTSGGLALGFAHSPAGCVLAAINILVRSSPRTGPSVFIATIRDQFYGADRQALSDQTSTDYADARNSQHVAYGQPLAPAAFVTVPAFSLDFYDGNTATVRVLMQLPDPTGDPVYEVTLEQLSYQDGDWRVMAPPDGDWAALRSVVAPTSLSDYQPLTVGS